MRGKGETKLSDDMIRASLDLEIESMGKKPSPGCWRKIEAGLERTRSPLKKPAPGWSRTAALVAACLLLLLGGIGIFRTIQFTSPAADLAEAPAVVAPGEEVAVLEADDPVDTDETFAHLQRDEPVPGMPEKNDLADEGNDFAVARVELKVITEPDPDPPDWPAAVGKDLALDEAVLISLPDLPASYQAAIYEKNEDRIIWILSLEEDEEMAVFIDALGRSVGYEFEDMGEEKGYKRIKADQLSGLAWQEEGRNQALLVLSGEVTEDELQSIASNDQ